MMKKVLFVLMALCCAWAAYDYSRPVEKYVVKTVAGEGDTLRFANNDCAFYVP